MRSSELTAWFLEDVSRWDTLSESSKIALAKHSPHKVDKVDKRGLPRTSTREDRLKAVLSLADGSRSTDEIALLLEVTRKEVHQAMMWLRRKGDRPVLQKRPISSRNLEIIKMRKKGVTLKRLSERYGVSVSRIQQITFGTYRVLK